MALEPPKNIQFPRKIPHLTKQLGSGPLWLKTNRDKTPPKWSPNFIRAVTQFARFMGLAYIPRQTVERLKSDKYFKYCFSPLIAKTVPYHKEVTFFDRPANEVYERLKMVLNDTDLTTDEDIRFGLSY